MNPITLYADEVRRLSEFARVLIVRLLTPQPVRFGDTSEYNARHGAADALWMPIGGIHQDRWPCPLGTVGDELYVRERYAMDGARRGRNRAVDVYYEADGLVTSFEHDEWGWHTLHSDEDRVIPKDIKVQPPSSMPAWASRCQVRVARVRCVQAVALSEEDARWAGKARPNALQSLYVDLSKRNPRGVATPTEQTWVWAVEVEQAARPEGGA